MLQSEIQSVRVTVQRRWRLDLFFNGHRHKGEPIYESDAEAFDAGLLWGTGQTEIAMELPPGLDFWIVSEWVVRRV